MVTIVWIATAIGLISNSTLAWVTAIPQTKNKTDKAVLVTLVLLGYLSGLVVLVAGIG